MGELTRAVKRFLRISLDAAIVAGISALLKELAQIQIPFYLQPIMTALLAAIAKYIRDKFGLVIPL